MNPCQMQRSSGDSVREGQRGQIPLGCQNRMDGDGFETTPPTEGISVNAFESHPELLKDASRGDIAREVAPLQAMEPELGKGIRRERPRRLGGKALSPTIETNPVPNLAVRVCGRKMQADCAEQLAQRCLVADGEREVVAPFPGRGMTRNPLRAAAGGIGMRNRQCRIRDFACAREAFNTGTVANVKRPEHEPLSYKLRNLSHVDQRFS